MAEQKHEVAEGRDKGQGREGAKAKGRGEKVATLPLDPAPKVAVGKPRLQAFYEQTVRPHLAKSVRAGEPAPGAEDHARSC